MPRRCRVLDRCSARGFGAAARRGAAAGGGHRGRADAGGALGGLAAVARRAPGWHALLQELKPCCRRAVGAAPARLTLNPTAPARTSTMCGIVGVDLQGARQPADLRRAAAAAAPRPGRGRHRHDAGHEVLHAQGARHGARRVPHAQHARAAGHRGPRPGALPDGRQRLQRGRGAAVLRQRAVRHRAGAQRQPDQRARAEGTSCSTSTAATSTPRATPRC